MAFKWEKTLPPPLGGAFLDNAGNPRTIPPHGAAKLQNMFLRAGYVRSRKGTVALFSAPDSKVVVDLFNVAFGDGTVEVIYHNRAQSYHIAGGAWTALTGATWTGVDSRRFWTVLAPFGSDAKGRILMNNELDAIRTWDGTTIVSLGANAVPARYAVMADDARLMTAYTVESGVQRAQRVRWTTIGLVEGDHTAWSATGSGALDLRSDPWRITNLWRQQGRIYVGKERAVCVLSPTGVATDAYSYDTLTTNGEGIFASHSLIQFGELVFGLSHRTFNLFDGLTFRDIMGDRNRETLFRRLNYSALDQITSVVDAANGRVGWGLPLDGASFPTELWWYDMLRDAWEMDPYPHTAITIFTNPNVITVDELVGQANALAGIADDLGGSASAKGIILAGKSNGTTEQFDGSSNNDNGSGFVSEYISTALLPQEEKVVVAGKEHIIKEDDFFVADEVVITLLDMGSTYTVTVEVSGDGRNFTSMGTTTVTTNGGTEAAPRMVRKKVNGRVPVEKQLQLRITNTTTGVAWGFADVTPKLDIVGRKR